MIYLIKSSGFNIDDCGNINYFQLLKIGYTRDKNKEIRFANYKLHNPTSIVLKEIPNATEKHEKLVQNKFKDLQYEKYGHEWFYYDQSIVDFFSNSTVDDLENLKNVIKIKKTSLRVKNSKLKQILKLVIESKKIDSIVSKVNLTLNKNLNLEEYIKEAIKYLQKKYNLDFSGYYCLVNRKFSKNSTSNTKIDEFLSKLNKLTKFSEKLKYISDNKNKLSEDEFNIMLSCINFNLRNYISILGLDRLKALGYNITDIKKEVEKKLFDRPTLQNAIYSNFKVGDRYTLSDLKNKVSSIYKSIGYTGTPRAIDIIKYFEIKEISFYEKLGEGKRRKIRGYELLKKLI